MRVRPTTAWSSRSQEVTGELPAANIAALPSTKISDLPEAVQDIVGALLDNSTDLAFNYTDGGNTETAVVAGLQGKPLPTGGTAGQAMRLNSAGTASEFYTPSTSSAGLTAVRHDATLTGDGTPGSPLSVVSGGGGGGGSGNTVRARAYSSVQLTVPTNTDYAIPLNSERYDTANLHSTSTHTTRMTIPAGEGGLYRIGGCIAWAANTNGRRRIAIRLNGSARIAMHAHPASPAGQTPMSIATEYELAAGDYVELIAFQDYGADVTLDPLLTPEPFGPAELWISKA